MDPITKAIDKTEELLGHSPHPAIVAVPIGAWTVSVVCDGRRSVPFGDDVPERESTDLRPGEALIRQDSPGGTMFVLRNGSARIEANGARLASLGPGQICGEMAFLEDSNPSATATAEEEVQSFSIEWKALIELFELFPHVASRFYRSLAVNLSRRLREQIVQRKV